jgi:hypothetical protein
MAWPEIVPHPNERVELAMKLLECRQRLRRVGWDEEQAKSLREEMERLQQQLREIDE